MARDGGGVKSGTGAPPSTPNTRPDGGLNRVVPPGEGEAEPLGEVARPHPRDDATDRLDSSSTLMLCIMDAATFAGECSIGNGRDRYAHSDHD
jgi:hypothetical protein